MVNVDEGEVVAFGIVNMIFDVGEAVFDPDLPLLPGEINDTLTIKSAAGSNGGDKYNQGVGVSGGDFSDDLVKDGGLFF